MSQGIASILSAPTNTAQLRLLAANGNAQVNDQVLQQFEALFLQNMLKSMRTASLGEGLFQSDQTEFYRDMYDQQIASDLAAKGTLGISDLINRQLGLKSQVSEGETTTSAATNIQAIVPVENAKFNQTRVAENLSDRLADYVLGVPYSEEIKANDFANIVPRAKTFEPVSPIDFVQYAKSQSSEAADKLGVSSDVIVAIAALETGWGKHVPSDSSGSSNNYFGIKADQRWHGEQVESQTLEFEQGVFNKLAQSFRAYGTLAESINDFANFLLGNERYATALEFAGDAKRFLQEIQQAGYATDPQYAEKVLNVLNSTAFSK